MLTIWQGPGTLFLDYLIIGVMVFNVGKCPFAFDPENALRKTAYNY